MPDCHYLLKRAAEGGGGGGDRRATLLAGGRAAGRAPSGTGRAAGLAGGLTGAAGGFRVPEEPGGDVLVPAAEALAVLVFSISNSTKK